MTATTTTAVLVPIQPAFTDAERLALAGFLAGYRGLTREAYALDLRQFTTWCRNHLLPLFAIRRADIESFARDLEARGRARATVTRRLCTIAGFYRYAVEEELLEHSPAAHVRRPRLDYESHATALDRNELGAMLVAARLGSPLEHALISLLALNGRRVSEATGADIEHLGLERGHRTLTITRKGGKVVTIALAPRTARAIDLRESGLTRRRGPVAVRRDRDAGLLGDPVRRPRRRGDERPPALWQRAGRLPGAHEAFSSRWIEEAIKVNSVHPRHSDAPFRRLHHYALLFHDEMLEALALDVESRLVNGTMREIMVSLTGPLAGPPHRAGR